MHAALWATKFCDITGDNTDLLENPQQSRPKLSQMWHDWFRKRIAENMPYDRDRPRRPLRHQPRRPVAGRVLQAVPRSSEEADDKGWTNTYADKPTLDLFWRRQQAVHGRSVGREDRRRLPRRPRRVRPVPQAPLRPLDAGRLPRLRQRLRLGELRHFAGRQEGFDDENAERKKNERTRRTRSSADPRNLHRRVPAARAATACTAAPRDEQAAGAQGARRPRDHRPRKAKTRARPCSTGCDAADNPFFARSFANRVWGHYFGVGIVDPVDNFSLANPPSNPKLLDALANDFIEEQIRHPPAGAHRF